MVLSYDAIHDGHIADEAWVDSVHSYDCADTVLPLV